MLVLTTEGENMYESLSATPASRAALSVLLETSWNITESEQHAGHWSERWDRGARVPLQLLHLEQLSTCCLSNYPLSKSLRVQVGQNLRNHKNISLNFYFYFCNPRLHSCKLPDHLNEICPLQQVVEPLLSYSDHFEKIILLLCCLCLAVMVCYDVDERHLWPGSLHQCLLRLSPPTPQTAQGQPSWGQSLPLSIFNKFEVYGKFYLSNQTHPLNINSTVPPASWFAANLGIGVGGHWGRIVRARCGPLSAR